MTPSRESVDAELSRLVRMPYGTARTHAVEQVVRRVEAEGPPESLAYGYSTLVDSYVWGNEVEKAYVPFTRWLRWYDEHPEHFDEQDTFSIFWSFKWMVSHLSDYPSVPADQIEGTLADMERRYAIAGHGMNAVVLEQFRWAVHRGAPETERLFEEWTRTPRDEFANCEACDPSERADYLAATGRVEQAARLIEQTLETDPSCGTEPADMLAQLALYYLELSQPVPAARAYRRSVRHLDGAVSDMAATRSRLVEFLALSGNGELAVRRIEQDQGLLTRADTPHSRLQFLRAVAAASRIVADDRPDAPVRLSEVPVGTVAELAPWAQREAQALAGAFDARNGSDACTRRLERALTRGPAPVSVDLSVTRASGIRAPGTGGGVDRGASGREQGVSREQGAGHEHGSAQEAVSAGALTGDAVDVSTAGGPGDLAAQADALVAAGDLEAAATSYFAAAAGFRQAGELLDGGFAEANAARCAQLLQDADGAHAAYRHALAVLRAGGARPSRLAPVLTAWAPSAVEVGASEDFLEVAALVRADAEAETAGPEAGRPEAGEGASAGSDASDDSLAVAAAQIADTQARVLAGAGRTREALDLAASVAERFAALGRFADASHAFWLTGKLHRALDRPEDAVWHLESAVEGFALARDRSAGAQAAGELIEVLRGLGRTTDADAVAAQLSS